MKITKPAILLLTAILGLVSSATLATDNGAQSNDSQANTAADAGQVTPDARGSVAPNNVDDSGVNTDFDSTILYPDGSSVNNDGITKDKEHKNTVYEGGYRPDISKKVQTGDGINNDVNTKTSGTTQ